MGRYRPPAASTSPYITPRGFQSLQDELKTIWKHRASVTRALAAAAAEGDRSENAEYIYRKKELREIDRRIRYLEKRLPTLKVVSSTPSSPDRVFFGANVTLEDESGNTRAFRIVGPDETEPGKGWISVDSPVARALMKKGRDDEVTVMTPQGNVHYVILSVEYEDFDP